MLRKIALYAIMILSAIVIVLVIYLFFAVRIDEPKIRNATLEAARPAMDGGQMRSLGTSWLRRSESGIWELYAEGTPYERGLVIGKLSEELMHRQEDTFVAQIREMIPSEGYIDFLRVFVAWFNRDLDVYVADEYKEEIFGISRSAPDEYDSIGPKYQRMLYYHAAHDIGHALLNMRLVGCTSFSLKGNKTHDGKIIAGRNFDFYVGDDFAKEKIVAFYSPSCGHKFMMVTWGGMTGVVSGMNEKGLAVTINAAAGSIPTHATTPISIIIREILQYAANIDEAVKIAKSRRSFVAESIMVSSAADNRTVVIEKNPASQIVFDPGTDTVISTNHYQKTRGAIIEESSGYRYKRVAELLESYRRMDVRDVAAVLRDRKGLGGRDIGMGNEKGINQFIAHHSVIFKPSDLIVWVSTSPYQSGRYCAYNLKKIFAQCAGMKKNREIYEKDLEIPEDPFVQSKEYTNFVRYKELKTKIMKAAKSGTDTIDDSTLDAFIASNPEMFYAYQIAGDYCLSRGQNKKARSYYEKALTKEVARKTEREQIRTSIKKSLKKS
jgi:isopenicillin-N N-acyltransferase-like protein